MVVWQIVKSLSGSLQREIPKPLSLQPFLRVKRMSIEFVAAPIGRYSPLIT